MVEHDFNASIRAAIDTFKKMELWRETVYHVKLPRSENFNKLCLSSRDYVKIYEEGLRLSHYNLLLLDFSYFQFSYSNAEEFALAYYPNPRLTGSPEAMEEFWDLDAQRSDGELSEEGFADLLSTAPAQLYVPRIRFEFSATQYKNVRHPAAHFHIGMSGEDRWASARKLSPQTFSLVIAKYYYPQAWWPRSRFSKDVGDQDAHLADCYDEKLLNSLKKDGVSTIISNDEKMGLHFAALNGPA